MLMVPLLLTLAAPQIPATPAEEMKAPALSLGLRNVPPGDRVELDVRVVHEVVDLGRTLAAGRMAVTEADRVVHQVGTSRWRVRLEGGKAEPATFQPVFARPLTPARIPLLSTIRLEGSLRVFRGFQLVRTLDALPILLCQGQTQVTWELVHEGEGPDGPRYRCVIRGDSDPGRAVPEARKPAQP